MSNLATDFYEKMYAEGREGQKPSGLLGFLFLKLRKYELHRIPAAFNLLGKGNTLLDLGCGEGWLISLAKQNKLYKKYYGVDLAKVVVERAKRLIKMRTGNLNSVYIKQANLDAKLPFLSKTFNTITCIAVLEHIFDPYFTVNEINRLLKKNGILVLELPNLVWLPRRIAILLGKLPVTGEEEGWDGGHLHYFTFAAAKKLLEDSGFQIEYMGSTGIFPRLRNIRPELLGGNILIKARKINDV